MAFSASIGVAGIAQQWLHTLFPTMGYDRQNFSVFIPPAAPRKRKSSWAITRFAGHGDDVHDSESSEDESINFDDISVDSENNVFGIDGDDEVDDTHECSSVSSIESVDGGGSPIIAVSTSAKGSFSRGLPHKTMWVARTPAITPTSMQSLSDIDSFSATDSENFSDIDLGALEDGFSDSDAAQQTDGQEQTSNPQQTNHPAQINDHEHTNDQEQAKDRKQTNEQEHTNGQAKTEQQLNHGDKALGNDEANKEQD